MLCSVLPAYTFTGGPTNGASVVYLSRRCYLSSLTSACMHEPIHRFDSKKQTKYTVQYKLTLQQYRHRQIKGIIQIPFKLSTEKKREEQRSNSRRGSPRPRHRPRLPDCRQRHGGLLLLRPAVQAAPASLAAACWRPECLGRLMLMAWIVFFFLDVHRRCSLGIFLFRRLRGRHGRRRGLIRRC